jgi:hypothetical protein
MGPPMGLHMGPPMGLHMGLPMGLHMGLPMGLHIGQVLVDHALTVRLVALVMLTGPLMTHSLTLLLLHPAPAPAPSLVISIYQCFIVTIILFLEPTCTHQRDMWES